MIDPRQIQTLIAAKRNAERALNDACSVLDPNKLYSENPNPPSVWKVIKGELVEITPIPFSALSPLVAPAPVAQAPISLGPAPQVVAVNAAAPSFPTQG